MLTMIKIRSKNSQSTAAFILKYTLITLLFLTFLLGLRWMWFSANTIPEHPKAVQGVLDMRGWDFENSPSISLDGEWEFFPGVFMEHEDLKESLSAKRQYVQVPGDWRSAFPEGSSSSYGYGTYRLRILVDQPLQYPYTVWVPQVEASSTVEINGEIIAKVGVPEATEEAYTPRKQSFTATYNVKDPEVIEVVVRTANFHNPLEGGIVRSLYFGSQAAIDTERWYSIGFQMATFLILVLHGLYAGILYIFNPRYKEFLVFFLLLFCVGIEIVSNYDNLVLLWLPIDYTWAIKVEALAYIWQPLLMILLVRSLSEQAEKEYSKPFRAYLSILSLYSVSIVLGTAQWVYVLAGTPFLFIIYFGPLLLFLFRISSMLMQNKRDAVFLLIAAASIFSNVTWSAIMEYQIIDIKYVYYPLDLIAALVCFSAYWFKRFFRNSEEKAKLTEQLKVADKLKDQFLAHTSHELRTPLHGIMNIAQTVVNNEKQVMAGRSTQDMELLITISRRMAHLLDDLLDVVRLQDKHIVLQKKPLHIQSVVSGIISMLTYMVEGKPVQLKTDIPDSIPPILADEKRLVQILFNLIHNALKFTDEGSVTVSAEVVDGQVAIYVSDTGIGMDATTKARMFLPYEQGAQATNEGGGIGLGLAICTQLVELHGSELGVESEPGKGSVFHFRLPVVYTDEMTVAESQYTEQIDMSNQMATINKIRQSESPDPWTIQQTAAHAYVEKKANILAIDDDSVNLRVLDRMLSSSHYQITTCTSPIDALDLLFTEQWDLLIIDVMMPHMSGYELTQKVREHFSVSELPILLLTARSQSEDVYTGYLSGANDYVCKPVDGMELKYRVWSLTTLKQTVDERLRMEAAYLQAQIHPHFLFNTLSSIMALSDIDTEKMRKLGDAFTAFLHISFDFLNTGKQVALTHELELVQAYLYIEKERFGERLSIEWEVEPDIDLLIPPLTIQPLVENAINHGLLTRLEGGTLHIRIVRQNNATLFEVEDDGIGMEEALVRQILDVSKKERGGIGVSNTNRRLTQLYGKGLSITSKPGEGTTVSFVIPDRL
ncbi:ATP-binding protein [Brevibacillus sp. 179-C 1.1 NHS]|uniref:hybrid sensor histidine kinase/response regulator n=1 Tax=Brevibacillus sp. 179-C 1.1 NHS TaxID=3235177 RepID=UPI0039A28C8E